MGMMKAGLIDALPENPKAAFVQAMMDSELASILGDEEDPRNMGEAEYNVSDPNDVPDNLEPGDTVNIQKESKMKKSDLKAKIKEMVLSEMNITEDTFAPESEEDFLAEVDDILAERVSGEWVEVFGDGVAGGYTAEEWGSASGSINYEIVTRIGPRVPRIYRSSSPATE